MCGRPWGVGECGFPQALVQVLQQSTSVVIFWLAEEFCFAMQWVEGSWDKDFGLAQETGLAFHRKTEEIKSKIINS